ncbi:hypothetical protein [Rhizobium leguminosarum]
MVRSQSAAKIASTAGFHLVGVVSLTPAQAHATDDADEKERSGNENPSARFRGANCEVETNSYGHKVRLKKGKRWLSIDGAVAAAMAVMRASLGGSAGVGSVYDHDDWEEALDAFG